MIFGNVNVNEMRPDHEALLIKKKLLKLVTAFVIDARMKISISCKICSLILFVYSEWISGSFIYACEEDIIRSYCNFNSFLKGTLFAAKFRRNLIK